MPERPTEKYLLPVLKALAGGEETENTEIHRRVAAELNLTEAERQEPGPAPNYPRYQNLGAHALKRLGSGQRGAGLLRKVRNDVYRITQEGRDLLDQEPETLTLDYLKRNYSVKAQTTPTGKRRVQDA